MQSFLNRPDHLTRAARESARWDDAVRLAQNSRFPVAIPVTTLTIDSDCHRIEALARQMQFGVGTARRGWLEPHDVLNTRRIDEVRAFVARKRTRG